MKRGMLADPQREVERFPEERIVRLQPMGAGRDLARDARRRDAGWPSGSPSSETKISR